MSQKINIKECLIVSQCFWPELIGSAPFTTDLAEWCTEHGITTSVLTGRPYYPENKVFPEFRTGRLDRQLHKGIQIKRMKTFVPRQGRAIQRVRSEGMFFARGVWALLTGKIKRSTTVISFAPSTFSVLLGSVLTRRKGHHVAIVHDIQSGLAKNLGMVDAGFVHSMMRAFERFCFNRANVVFVLSKQMRDVLREIGINKPIKIAPIWVDTEAIVPMPELEPKITKIVYSGNLGRKQGFDQLIAAAELLCESRPEIKITIRGAGSQQELLMITAKKKELKNLVFEPLCAPDRFCSALADATLYIVPQDPNAADFAVPSKVYSIMAAGKTFIATARKESTLADLATETGGAFKIVPPYNPKATVAAILELVDNDERRISMGLKGREYVSEAASRDHVIFQIIKTADIGSA